MARKPQKPTVAFVLSGGAGLGAIQVGMLRALYERDTGPPRTT
jgi:predicted acylesterase/phospholipase RssA